MWCTLHTYDRLGFLQDQCHIFSSRPNFVKHSCKIGPVERRMGPISGFGTSKVYNVSFIGKILTHLQKIYFYTMSFKCLEKFKVWFYIFTFFIVSPSFFYFLSICLLLFNYTFDMFLGIHLLKLNFCCSKFIFSRPDRSSQFLEHRLWRLGQKLQSNV
jgi:hypothetical protein